MKKLLLTFSGLLLFVVMQAQTTYTSNTAGFFTNPTTWTPMGVPFPGDSIIINHAVSLNTDWGYSSGAIIIGASGSLIQNASNRAFATLFGGRFENAGTFNVDSVGFFGGNVHNTGTFTSKLLYSNVVTEGGLTTSGNMTIGTNFYNQGMFNISSVAATITVGGDFMHGDSSLSTVLICDGDFNVTGDFLNIDTIRGSGQFCIYGSSMNTGTVTGLITMCDVSGGNNVDLNTGTISGTVTGCSVSTCVGVGIEDNSTLTVTVYPNPATDIVQVKSEEPVNIVVFDLMGKAVYQSTTANQIQNISVTEWATGVYTYRIFNEKGASTGKFIKQ